MSTEVTMDKLEPILKGISAQIEQTNANVSGMRKELSEARKDISDTITKHAVMEERIKNIKEHTDKQHEKLEKSLSLNWTLTRSNKSNIVRWGGVITGASIAIGAIFKYVI